MKYDEYIQSKAWQEKRAKLIKFEGCCQLCWKSRDLTVHHISYDRLGHELSTDLVVLCNACHILVHRYMREAIKKGWKSLQLYEGSGYMKQGIRTEVSSMSGRRNMLEELEKLREEVFRNR